MYMWSLVTFSVRRYLGVIGYICANTACNSKTHICRVKTKCNLNAGVVCNMYMEYLRPFSVQHHFGVTRCTSLKRHLSAF